DVAGAKVPYPEVQDTISDFAVLKETLLNDIASAYNRQPPSWLLEAISELIPEAGSIRQGAAGAQSKLKAIQRQLQQELSVASGSLKNQLSPQMRQEIGQRVIGLDAALQRIG